MRYTRMPSLIRATRLGRFLGGSPVAWAPAYLWPRLGRALTSVHTGRRLEYGSRGRRPSPPNLACLGLLGARAPILERSREAVLGQPGHEGAARDPEELRSCASGFRRNDPSPRRFAGVRAPAQRAGHLPGAPRRCSPRPEGSAARGDREERRRGSLVDERSVRPNVLSMGARCRRSMWSSVQRVTARSIALRSSRTFPGQLWFSRNA